MSPTRRLKSRAVVAVLTVVVAAVLVATTYARTQRHHQGVRPVAAHVAGNPFGPATRTVREAWAAVLRCEYAHGATKQPLEDGSFEVAGLTAEIKAACSSQEQGADQAMADPEYANERAALGQMMRDVWNCVASHGVVIGQDSGRDDHQPEPAGALQAFASCKKQVEAASGLQEPAPLP